MEQPSKVIVDAAERLLAFEAGGELRTAEEGAAAVTRIYEKLYRQLSPIIGEIGFEILFARTVKLTKPAFAGLQELDPEGPADAVLERLRAYLRKQAPATTTDIVTALIVIFVGLLSTFIGEGLTSRLLRNAWPEALPNEPPSGENA